MSPHACAPALTSLPLPLLSRILRHLSPDNPHARGEAPRWAPFNDPAVEHTLHCARAMTAQLPSELLPPAQASPVLAAAAAAILRDRVSYLTFCNTGGQLAAWVAAFARYVRAVSTGDPFHGWINGTLRGRLDWMYVFDTQRDHSIRLFRTLSVHAVRLEVLDLLDVHFLNLSQVEDDIMAGLCATLESNSGTLRELALPVFCASDICDKALAMAHLKKLDVLTVKPWSRVAAYATGGHPPPILRMIRAVDGHADRARKLTTLRELRLLEVGSLGYTSLTPAERSSSIFRSIRTLRIVWLSDTYSTYGNERFISLFKNLDSLFWNVNPGSSDMFFEKLCTKVPEVHLCGMRWIIMPAHVGAKVHSGEKCGFFGERSYDCDYGSGAIVSIYAGPMPATEIATMMSYCPKLQNLSVNVTRENIRAIRKLVAKCQLLKCLELVFDEERDGRLEVEDWRAISRTVPKSHKNLCQVAIQNPGRNERAMTAIEAVFACFERVAKALGDRARRLSFRALVRTRKGAKIMERICDLLNVCLQHTPVLESLEILPYILDRDVSDYDADWEKGVAKRLIHVQNRLISEVQSLRMLNVGVSPSLLRRISRSHDSVSSLTKTQFETDSMSSETE